FLRGKGEDFLVARRQFARRVGIAGVAGEGEGLAAAAAPVDLAKVAALAGLGHPSRAAIGLKGRRIIPDPVDRMVAHRFEGERGDALGGVTREHSTSRRDVEELPAPAAHAFLRTAGIIVGDDVVDGEDAFQSIAGFVDDPRRLLKLICTWSRPARSSAAILASSSSTAEVMRLV